MPTGSEGASFESRNLKFEVGKNMSKYKVYVTDYEYETLEHEKKEIAKLDAGFIPLQCKTEQDLISKACDADALLVQYAPITDNVLQHLGKLKIVVRYGVGVDCVDVDSASKRGVYVCNVPDYGVDEVSTHAMTLILDSMRKIQLLSGSVKNGRWDYKISKPIHRMKTLTLGIAGFGRIPRQVAKKAKEFGFNMIAYDPFVEEAAIQEYGASKVDFDTLIRESDVVTIHIPLTNDTYHIFDKDVFSRMKRGSFLVNTSRGALIDESALIYALDSKILAGAALDVCETEPLDQNSPLRNYANVIITPHVAWYSEEAQVDLQRKAAEEVVRVLSGQAPLHCVNIKNCRLKVN